MKLSESLNYINQALNYPSLTYNDISLFFDTAIAELNTTLHTDIPRVSKMIENFKQNLSKSPTVLLTTDPQVYPEIVSSTVGITGVYYNPDERLFHYGDTLSSKDLDGLYFRDGIKERYKATVVGTNAAWQWTDYDNVLECEFSDYLPDEWMLLWLIPYICFKYTVRDGGTASSFAEDLTQGFQQLQETYDVPETVNLTTYADKIAYADLVAENLPNIDITVRTRAIYNDMKHNRALNAFYGSMYDRGGF